MLTYSSGNGTWADGRIFRVLGALLFGFIAACFVVALTSYFICWSRRDWRWLVLGLAFTLGADYFLILHNRHLPGVAVFCFAHVAYIMRAVSDKKSRIYALLPFAVAGLAIAALAMVWLDGIYVVTAMYGTLFVTNIYLSARHIRRNRALVMTGLLLFAACDICVLLFNLPRYMGAPEVLRIVFPLIWVFYLPSQVLLAVSAVDFSRVLRQHACE